MSDMQLTTLDELEDHINDMQEDNLQELKVDVHNFLDYWPRTSKQHLIDDISHIFGVVRPHANKTVNGASKQGLLIERHILEREQSQYSEILSAVLDSQLAIRF